MTSEVSVSPLTNTRYGLGEGPFWDSKNQKLFIVDAFLGDFIKIDPQTQVEEKINFSPHVVTFIVGNESDDDLFTVSRDNDICSLRWSTKELNSLKIVEINEGTRFNDAKCDSKGRLWAGTMSSSEWTPPGKGSLYKISSRSDKCGKTVDVQKQFSPVILSNGIAWTNDDSRMFFVDSTRKVVYSFNYDTEEGNTTNPQIFLDFEKTVEAAGVPDGIAMDADGKLWIACFGGSRILRVDLETSKVVSKIDMPTLNVTSLAFGGPNLDTIYSTTAKNGEDPNGGAVYKIVLTKETIRGTPSQRFNDS